jgi:hypothetical protein
MKFDLLIKDCLVVDPKNGRKAVASLGIRESRIADVADDLPSEEARQVLRFPGKMLMPGLIDTHVHCSPWLGGSLGFAMMARAGVTTAVDLAGPAVEVAGATQQWGSGMNIAVLNAVHPGKTVSSSNPSYAELREMVEKSLASGALGVKLLGGHYPLTPEATRNAIKAANEEQAYLAFHAGSAKNGSNLNGLMDAVEFSEGRSFQLAHVNAYCRGLVLGDPIEEVQQALRTLKKNRHIVSEFHLATVNGTSGVCIDGKPESHVTRTALKMGGFEPTEDGLKKSFLDGWGYCTAENVDGENKLINGREALEYWTAHGGNCTVGFPVNNRTTAFLCATGKDEQGNFIIDALSTDGGGIPRNFLLKFGLQLVEWGAWTLTEFVSRTSYMPSLMLGLRSKGHLTQGADADLTIVDLEKREAVATIAHGDLICVNGVVTGKGGTFLCTKRGERKCGELGVDYQTVDLGESMLYSGRGKG